MLRYGSRRIIWEHFNDCLSDADFDVHCTTACAGVESWLSSDQVQLLLDRYQDPFLSSRAVVPSKAESRVLYETKVTCSDVFRVTEAYIKRHLETHGIKFTPATGEWLIGSQVRLRSGGGLDYPYVLLFIVVVILDCVNVVATGP